jgi:hypothetical protein
MGGHAHVPTSFLSSPEMMVLQSDQIIVKKDCPVQRAKGRSLGDGPNGQAEKKVACKTKLTHSCEEAKCNMIPGMVSQWCPHPLQALQKRRERENEHPTTSIQQTAIGQLVAMHIFIFYCVIISKSKKIYSKYYIHREPSKVANFQYGS